MHIAHIVHIVLIGQILYILYTIVHVCTIFCTKLFFSIASKIVHYCTVLCTKLYIARPRWRGARLLPRRLPRLIALLVLLLPTPSAARAGSVAMHCPSNHWGALYFSESRQLRRAGAAYAGPPPPPAAGGGAPLRKSKGSTKPSTFFKTRSTSTFSTMGRQLERLLCFLDGGNSLYHSRSSAQRNDLHRAFAG